MFDWNWCFKFDMVLKNPLVFCIDFPYSPTHAEWKAGSAVGSLCLFVCLFVCLSVYTCLWSSNYLFSSECYILNTNLQFIRTLAPNLTNCLESCPDRQCAAGMKYIFWVCLNVQQSNKIENNSKQETTAFSDVMDDTNKRLGAASTPVNFWKKMFFQQPWKSLFHCFISNEWWTWTPEHKSTSWDLKSFSFAGLEPGVGLVVRVAAWYPRVLSSRPVGLLN